MIVVIQVEYLGVVRLLTAKKEESFQFTCSPTLGQILECLGNKYGQEIAEECLNQMIFLHIPGFPASQLKWPRDQDVKLENGSLLRFISMVTGG